MLEDYREFQPSVEVSRGCGMGCVFCAEATEPLAALMDADTLAEEFVQLVKHYASRDIHPYLEASLFRPSSEWSARLGRALQRRNVALAWRAETRVDTISTEQISALAEAGLRVLDLGLESASPEQLVRMRKTTKPDVYLRRASDLLHTCHASGIWTKVNVLLHPGETPATIAETEAWLEAHRNAIKGLSVGPTILFRYGQASLGLLREFATHGASATDPEALDRDGYASLHLSPAVSHEAAKSEALRLSRSFMSARDYFDLKSFSYFPRSFSWETFRALVGATPDAAHSFRVR
ncbi:MAG: radical SAM protein [Myxococcales bacterium]|nr:radical SAM protein [Myxococcales bacterium]